MPETTCRRSRNLSASFDREKAGTLCLIDEIGKMECLSGRFVAAVAALLESTTHVIASIAARGDASMQRIKDRRDADLWQVTRANRNGLPSQVFAWLKERHVM